MIRTAVEERRTQNPLLSWWETSTLPALEVLPSTATLVGLRTALVNSFVASVEPAGISRFVAAGMAATWWEDSTFDLKAAASRGWKAVLEGWLTTAEASQDDKNAPDLADTLAIRILAGEHLASRATLAIEATRLDAEVKAAEVTESDEEGEDEDRDNAISPAELKKLKADRTKAKKALKSIDDGLLAEARERLAAMTDNDAFERVSAELRGRIARLVDDHSADIQRRITAWHDHLADKYAITLHQLEAALRRRLRPPRPASQGAWICVSGELKLFSASPRLSTMSGFPFARTIGLVALSPTSAQMDARVGLTRRCSMSR